MAHEDLTWEQEKWLRTLQVEEQQRILWHLSTGEYVLVTYDGGSTFVVVEYAHEGDQR